MALRKRGGIWYFRKRSTVSCSASPPGSRTRSPPNGARREIEHDIRAGIHGWKSTIPSFAEWWAVYRKTYTPLKSARNRDAQIVAHFLPHFGAKRLDEITKSDIVRYLNLRRTQMTGNPGHKNRRLVSESTVRRERGLAAVHLRARHRRRARHPQPVPRHQAREGQAADSGADARRRDAAAGSASPALPAVRPVRARDRLPSRRDPRHRSERDIDWLRGTVHVIGKFRKERDVPMQPDARAALEEQLEEEGKLWKQNPQRLREVLAEGSARAKIPSLTPHALRHTFGTRWLQAGGDIYKLSKILGHSSVAVTEAHYAHLLKEDLVAASQQVKIPVAPRGTGNVVRMPRRRAQASGE